MKINFHLYTTNISFIALENNDLVRAKSIGVWDSLKKNIGMSDGNFEFSYLKCWSCSFFFFSPVLLPHRIYWKFNLFTSVSLCGVLIHDNKTLMLTFFLFFYWNTVNRKAHSPSKDEPSSTTLKHIPLFKTSVVLCIWKHLPLYKKTMKKDGPRGLERSISCCLVSENGQLQH